MKLAARELSAHDRLQRPEHGLVVSNVEGDDPSCHKKMGGSYPTHDGGSNGETIRRDTGGVRLRVRLARVLEGLDIPSVHTKDLPTN